MSPHTHILHVHVRALINVTIIIILVPAGTVQKCDALGSLIWTHMYMYIVHLIV